MLGERNDPLVSTRDKAFTDQERVRQRDGKVGCEVLGTAIKVLIVADPGRIWSRIGLAHSGRLGLRGESDPRRCLCC